MKNIDEGNYLEFSKDQLFAELDKFKKIADENSEKEVPEYSEKLLKAQELARWGFIDWDIPSNEMKWSDQIYAIWGLDRSEKSNVKSIIEAIHPEDVQQVHENMEMALQGIKEYNMEHRIIRPNDGEVRWIQTQSEIMRNDEGTLMNLRVTALDITEQKAAKIALVESEKNLSLIYNTASDVIFQVKVERDGYRFLTVNKRFIIATGIPREAIEGKRISEVIPEPSLSLVLLKYKEAIELKKPVRWEEVSQYSTGEKIGVVTIAPFYNDAGKCTHLVGSVHDITQRKKAEKDELKIRELLLESENEHRVIFENAAAGIMISEAKTKNILNTNASMTKILGYSKEEFLSMKLSDLVPSNLLEEAERILKQVVEKDVKFEIDRIHKNGSLVRVQLFLSKAKFRNGLSVILCNIVDVSEKREKQVSIEESERRFRKLTESASDSIIVVNSKNEIVFWNTGAELDFEYTVQETLNKSVNKILPSEYQYNIEQDFKEVNSDSRNTLHRDTVELKGKKKSGKEFPVELRVTTWEIDGEVYYCMIMRDLTNRKLSEKKLLLSDTILRNIGNFILAENGDIFYASSSISEKLGFTQEEILENSWFLNTTKKPTEIRKKRTYIKNTLKGRALIVEPYEIWITDKKGQERCILWHDTIAPGKVLISIGTDITERIEAKKIIEESEQLKNGILSSLSTHIGVLDSKGVLIATNEAWNKFSDTLKTRKVKRPKKGDNYLLKVKEDESFDKLSVPICSGIVSVMKRKEKYFYKDYRSNEGEGNVWYTLRVTPFGNEKGVVVTHTNITDSVLANIALKESEKKFRQLTESIQEAFWLTDWKTKETVYVSPAYNTIYGCSNPGTLHDENLAAHIHPDDKIWILEEYRNKAESGNYDVEFRIIHPNGKIRWIHERAFPIKEGDKILKMAGYSSDITDRRNTQDKLAKSEEEYRLLFERNLSGVYRSTIDNVFIECNDSFARILGFDSREEVIDKNARLLYENLETYNFSEELDSNGGNLIGFESKLRLNDGRIIWVLENASLINGDKSSDLFVEGTIIDITKLKEAELQIEALAKFPDENPNPVLRIDSKNRIIFVNQAGAAMADHITLNSNILIPFYRKTVEEARSVNRVVEIEQKVRDRFYAFSIVPVKEHDYVNIYGKDITERTRIDLIREITFVISRKATSKVLSINSLSRIIHHELSKVLPAKNLYLALYDKKKDQISFPYFKDEKVLSRRSKTYRNRPFGQGITEKVIKSKMPLLIKKKGIIAAAKGRDEEYGTIPESWVGVPLTQAGEVFGVLAVQSYVSSDVYTQESVEFLDFVAGQIGSLIQRVNSTALILKQQKDLNSEKEKLKNQRDLALQYQSMLLSSQLNPHFIFNSLNSIQYFILDKDPMPALNFLTNFSSLMRLVLTNSIQKYITLTDEIVFLEMYLNLELTRYSDKFRYEIIISENVDTDELMIPPMLLQPFIENTVIHGVGNLVKGGVIIIKFKKKGSKIECLITDNGVGRKEAALLKVVRQGISSKSLSTDINSSRIEILNRLECDQYSAKITDRKSRDGMPVGTQVVVTFPISQDD
jgi:PAS domain S-box-containing protein